jgi:hypothetical protein
LIQVFRGVYSETRIKVPRRCHSTESVAFEWASRFGPWLLALALGILAFLGWRQQP